MITIVLTVYKPVLEWFVLLLESLNKQDYDNKELLIYNDNPQEPLDKEFISRYIKFPFKIYEGESNIGSNKGFEYLTKVATGDYIAYCDQDDIWEYNKLSKTLEVLKEENALLAYSDLSIINDEGEQTHKSFRELSKRHKYYSGEGAYKILFVRNFVVGCTMLIDSRVAKEALPFAEGFYHDHWLALFTSIRGKLAFVDEPLIRYRIHRENQTGVLKGINTKEDYFNKRIKVFYERSTQLESRLEDSSEVYDYYSHILEWARARYNYYNKINIKDGIKIFKNREFGKGVSLFELSLPFITKPLFNHVINRIKQGKL